MSAVATPVNQMSHEIQPDPGLGDTEVPKESRRPELSGVDRVLAELEEDELGRLAQPGDPGWLEPGESPVTFVRRD